MQSSFFSRKTMVTAVATLAIAGTLAVSAGSAEAGWRGRSYNGGAVAAGVIGGMALGALAAGAARSAYAAPAPGYYYGGPREVYYDDGPECYVSSRRVWVDGWGWRRQRVTVCD